MQKVLSIKCKMYDFEKDIYIYIYIRTMIEILCLNTVNSYLTCSTEKISKDIPNSDYWS